MAHSRENIISTVPSGRQCRCVGRYVFFPPQDKASAVCGWYAVYLYSASCGCGVFDLQALKKEMEGLR